MSRVSPLLFARRVWQRHRWSVPLCLASATFFARLGWELHQNELDVFDTAAQRLVDGWRGSCDELMVFLTAMGDFIPMTLLVVAVFVVLLAAGRTRELRF